jgi:hypothetical protein
MNAIGSFVEWGPALVGSIILVRIFNLYVKPLDAVKWKN